MKFKSFPFYKQTEEKDCGATCIKIVAKHYNKNISIERLRVLSETTREGSSLLRVSSASEKVGFRSLGIKVDLNTLLDAPLPCILHWNNNHYVVLYKVESSSSFFLKGKKSKTFYISDPAHSLLKYTKEDFLKHWVGDNANNSTKEGIALLLETTPKFFNDEESSNLKKDKIQEFGFKFLIKYLFKYKRFIWQLIIGLFAASLLQVVFPFLTQSVVDVGIKNQDVHFIYLILFAQLSLFIGRTSIEILRGWILLHLSTRISISLVSDFFIKLMNLPISYFDTQMTGDILQRINDHGRIERILTRSTLNMLFSLTTLVMFTFILAYYSSIIFIIFIFGSFLYFLWVYLFLVQDNLRGLSLINFRVLIYKFLFL